MLFRSRVFLASAIALALSAGPLAADWSPIGPNGGPAVAVAAAPSQPSRLYAALASGDVYRSADQGRSWVLASSFAGDHSFVRLLVDPLQPARVFAVRSDGLFRSNDGAATWVRIEPDLEPPGAAPAQALAVHTRKPANLLASFTHSGLLYRSADRGRTWQRVANLPATDIRFIETVPAEPETFWAVTGSSRVFRSTNGGRSWTAAHRGLPAGLILSFTVDPRSPRTAYISLYNFPELNGYGLYKTTNGGASWQKIRTALATEIAADPVRPFVYAAFENGNLYRSPDGGGRWVRVENGLLGQVKQLEATRSGLLAASTSGIFRSPDHARTWQTASRGISGMTISGLAIDEQSPPRLYAGDAVSGVFKSRDRGASWLGLPNPAVDFLRPWERPLAVSPADPEVVYAGVNGAIAKSTNGGRRWTRYGGLFCLQPSRIEIDPRDTSTLFVSGSFHSSGCGTLPHACTLYRSQDAGETWQCSGGTQPGRTGVRLLGIDPLTSAVYAQTSPKSLWRSADQGDTWTLIYSGQDFYSFAASALAPGTHYAGGQGEVGRSRDSGQTWDFFSTGLPEDLIVTDLALGPTDEDVLYAVTEAGVYRSTDEGETWAPLGDWPDVKTTPHLVVDPVDPSIVYVGTEGNGVWRYTEGDLQ